MRVCVLLPVHWKAGMGGAEYQARLLVEHWAARYDVEIVYLTARADSSYRPASYRVVQFSSDRGLRRYGTFFDALRLYRALRAIRPDVIYQQVGCAHTGVAAYYARRNGCRMAWRVSSDRSVEPLPRASWRRPHHWLERVFLEYGIRRADVIFAQNAAQQRLLRERYGREPALVRNFHPAPALAAPPPARERRTVIWIGNLKRLKNPHAFLRLAAAFSARPDLEFVMIGARLDSTPWTTELLAAIRAAPNVNYLGALPQVRVNEHLENASVLVNTSDYEGFPNTFVQAWLRGVPVVSLHADPDGLLSEGGLGFASADETSLHAHVRQVVDDPQGAARIGRAAREYALAAHSMANADQMAQLLGLPPASRAAVEPVADAAPGPAAALVVGAR